jgi:hypothetical protein
MAEPQKKVGVAKMKGYAVQVYGVFFIEEFRRYQFHLLNIRPW